MSKTYTLTATVTCKSGTSRSATLASCTTNYTSNKRFGGTGASNQYACILAFDDATMTSLRALPSTAFKSISLDINATTKANNDFITYYGPQKTQGTASAEISSSSQVSIAKNAITVTLDLLSIGIPASSNAYCIGCQSSASNYGYMQGITATLTIETYEDCYYITYNANGGSTTPLPTYATTTGSTSVALTSTVPTKDWCEFLGWSRQSNRISPLYTNGSSFSLTGNITLYAVWAESAQIRYKLTNIGHVYNSSSSASNTGSSGTAATWGFTYTSSYQYYRMHAWLLNEAELQNIKDKISAGATLDAIRCAWTTTSRENVSYATRYIAWKSNNSTTSTAAGSRISTGYINSNDADYHYESFDGFNNYEDIPVSAGVPTYGVCFRPNSTTQTRSCQFTLNISAGIGLYFTLTEPRLTLSFNANGGSGAPILDKHRTTTGSSTFTIPSYAPTKSGLLFLGWSTNQTSSVASYQPSDTITISGDTILYAIWGTEGNTLHYFNGTMIKDCELYYFNGTSLKECELYYFNGTTLIKTS